MNKDIQALSDVHIEALRSIAQSWMSEAGRDSIEDWIETVLATRQPAPAVSQQGGGAVPEGWQLVPKEPTQQMVNDGVEEDSDTLRGVYRAMLAAAPNPPADAAPVDAGPRYIANPDDLQTKILHAMYHCAQRGDTMERMHFDVCQIIANQPSLQAVGSVPSKEIPTELLKALNKHCCENVAWIRHAWMEYVATAPQPSPAPADAVPAQTGMQGEALSQEAKLYFGFSDEQAAIEAAKTLSMIGVPLNESGALDLCHAFLKLRKLGSERDALIAQLRSELALAESSIKSMADSMDSMTHQLNLNAKD